MIKGEEETCHMFPARWLDDNPRGHRVWQSSEVAHVVSDNSLGPLVERLGPGRGPSVCQRADGEYVVYAFMRMKPKTSGGAMSA